MTINAFDGPVVGGFPGAPISGMPTNTNPEAGPSLFNHGVAVLDQRTPYTYIPGENFGKQTCGWATVRAEGISQTVSAKQTNNLATAQTATAGTALTLTAGTGVTSGVSIVRADTGATVTGLLALDSAMTTVKFGQAQTIQIWDPTKALARNIRITSNGTDQTGTYTVAGFDIYGYPMTETIAGTSASVASGTKAFKYIQSVTPGGTVTSTGVIVGTGDVLGFPLRADDFGHVDIIYDNARVNVSTGFTAAVTTTATSTSGDVRGTYALQTASTGTGTLRLFITIPPANLSNSTGLVGVPQA